ncbi:MAG: hypothetical protein ACW968_06840 [Candidatus Thorarchaeota archaeon]
MHAEKTDKAERVADALQTLSRLIVLLIILPIAAFLTTYIIVDIAIDNALVTGLVSVAISLGFAGLVLSRTGRVLMGAALVVTSTIIAAASFILFWNQLYGTLFVIHGLFLLNLLILRQVKRSETISEDRLNVGMNILAFVSFITGPLAIFTSLIVQEVVLSLVLAITIFSLSFYGVIWQFIRKDERFGILNCCLLALGIGSYFLHIYDPGLIFSDLSLTSSIFLVGGGVGLFLSSQLFRRIQGWLLLERDDEDERERIIELLGIKPKRTKTPEEEEESAEPEYLGESLQIKKGWLINLYAAQSLSGLALIMVSLGFPPVFLWLASLTTWGLETHFILLMLPVGLLISLLVLAPSIVLLRLGERIRRTTESSVVRIIGVSIVLVACVIQFIWTQFFSWSFAFSLTGSFLLFVSGITGLFRDVRRYWKRIWLRLIGAVRNLKKWILRRLLLSGVIGNIAITILTLYITYPFLIFLPGIALSLPSVSMLCFTAVGVVGLVIGKGLKRRNTLLAIAWISFLISLALISFWHLFFVSIVDLLESITLSALCLLPVVAIQKLGVGRFISAVPYLPSFISIVYITFQSELVFSLSTFPLLTIGAAICFLSPILHIEYVRLGSALNRGLVRVGSAIKDAAIRVGDAISRGFSAIGRRIYHAFTVFAALFVKFILIAYGFLILIGLVYLGFSMFATNFETNTILSFVIMACAFFILYIPMLGWKKKTQTPLMIVCLGGLATSVGVSIFFLIPDVNILLRVLSMMSAISGILLVSRNWLPERTSIYLPETTWIFVLSSAALYVFLFFSPIFDLFVALSSSVFLFGIGCLPLKTSQQISRWAGGIYVIIAVPSGVVLTYLLTLNIAYAVLALFFIPIPIVYQQYVKAGRLLASALLLFGRTLIVFVALHLVAVAGFLALFSSFVIVQYVLLATLGILLDIVQTGQIFILLLFLIWLPAIALRKSENARLLTLSLLVVTLIISYNVAVFIQYPDPLVSILIALSTGCAMITVVAPGIHFLKSRKWALASLIGFALLLGVYLLPGDVIQRVLVSAIGYSALAAPLLNDINRVRVAYPVITGSCLGLLFWQLNLMFANPILMLSGFIAAESFLLLIPKQLRSWPFWLLFSMASSFLIYNILLSFTWVSPLIAIIFLIESIRVTPNVTFQFSDYEIPLGIIRSVLVTAVIGFTILPLIDLIIVGELSIFVFAMVLQFSIGSKVRELFSASLLVIAAGSLSLLAYTYLTQILMQSPILSIYPCAAPLIALSIAKSIEGSYRQKGWNLFTIIATVLISSSWYVFYGQFEVLLLSLTTGIFVILLCSVWIPGKGVRRGLIESLVIISFLVLVESVWIWHAILVLQLSPQLILSGIALIMLSLILFPIRGAISWVKFEFIWDFIATFVAISIGALLTNWDLTSLTLPYNPLYTLGVCLSIFSLVSTPAFVAAEDKGGFEKTDMVSHFTWLPSLPGWGILLSQWSLSIFNDVLTSVLIGALGFSLAGLIFYRLMPEPDAKVALSINLIFSISFALLFWQFTEFSPIQELRLSMTILIWYLTSLPILLPPTISGISKAIRVLKRNIPSVIIGVPIILGIWAGSFYLGNPVVQILGIPVRAHLSMIGVAVAIVAAFYFLETLLLSPDYTSKIEKPSVILGGLAVFLMIALAFFPVMLPDLSVSVYLFSGASFAAFTVMLVLCRLFGWDEPVRTFLVVDGLSLTPFTYFGLTLFGIFPPSFAILVAIVLLIAVESPLLKNQLLWIFTKLKNVGARILAILGNLGHAFATAIRRLSSALRLFFNRFGYWMWATFSVIFTVLFGILSRPFFSELINMTQGGLFYEVPSFSVPLLILGMLLLAVAIVRRKVRTPYGSMSGTLGLIGLGITITVALYDYGYAYNSVFVAILSFCFTGLAMRSAIGLGRRWIALFWSPIPICIAAISLQFFYSPTESIRNQMFAVSLAILIAAFLYLSSSYSKWISSTSIKPTWIILAGLAGIVIFLAPFTNEFPLLASIYLSVLIASIVMFPATGRSMKQIFLSPLFFSLTGFAFMFVFGELYQSLLLALAASLLFVSLYIKEKEVENPKLVYARIAVLLILVSCIAIFAVSVALVTLNM